MSSALVMDLAIACYHCYIIQFTAHLHYPVQRILLLDQIGKYLARAKGDELLNILLLTVVDASLPFNRGGHLLDEKFGYFFHACVLHWVTDWAFK